VSVLRLNRCVNIQVDATIGSQTEVIDAAHPSGEPTIGYGFERAFAAL
jgi:hypothetical protein